MADQSKRGGQKQGTTGGANSQQHQGVRPGSTTQNKSERQPKQKRPVSRSTTKDT